jgi:hypothetical protein
MKKRDKEELIRRNNYFKLFIDDVINKTNDIYKELAKETLAAERIARMPMFTSWVNRERQAILQDLQGIIENERELATVRRRAEMFAKNKTAITKVLKKRRGLFTNLF